MSVRVFVAARGIYQVYRLKRDGYSSFVVEDFRKDRAVLRCDGLSEVNDLLAKKNLPSIPLEK